MHRYDFDSTQTSANLVLITEWLKLTHESVVLAHLD